MAGYAEKVQHLRRWNVCCMMWLMFMHTCINGRLRQKGTTLTALFHAHHTLTQGSLHYRLATLGYQRYNAYSVEKAVLLYDL